MTDAERIAKLEAELAELKAAQAKREVDPFVPFGARPGARIADGLGIPRDALEKMLAASPPDLMKQLREDAQRPSVHGGFVKPEERKPGSGWQDTQPLRSPVPDWARKK